MSGFLRNRRTPVHRLLRLQSLLHDDLDGKGENQSAVDLFLTIVQQSMPEIGEQLRPACPAPRPGR